MGADYSNRKKPVNNNPEQARINGRKGGRPKGMAIEAITEIRALAAMRGPAAIARLVVLMGEERHVAVAACRELLDRGFGKGPQPHDGDVVSWEK
jgi:hypothetical protein